MEYRQDISQEMTDWWYYGIHKLGKTPEELNAKIIDQGGQPVNPKIMDELWPEYQTVQTQKENPFTKPEAAPGYGEGSYVPFVQKAAEQTARGMVGQVLDIMSSASIQQPFSNLAGGTAQLESMRESTVPEGGETLFYNIGEYATNALFGLGAKSAVAKGAGAAYGKTSQFLANHPKTAQALKWGAGTAAASGAAYYGAAQGIGGMLFAPGGK